MKTKLEKADLCLVFGARYFDKFAQAVKDLYEQNLFRFVLISGGINRFNGQEEAYNIKQRLLDLGLPEEIILMKNKASNTYENVVFSEKIIRERLGWENIKKIIAVGKDYGARRYLMTMEKNFPEDVEKMLYTINVFDWPEEQWYEHEEYAKMIRGEYEKIPLYLAQGDIKEIKI